MGRSHGVHRRGACWASAECISMGDNIERERERERERETGRRGQWRTAHIHTAAGMSDTETVELHDVDGEVQAAEVEGGKQ